MKFPNGKNYGVAWHPFGWSTAILLVWVLAGPVTGNLAPVGARDARAASHEKGTTGGAASATVEALENFDGETGKVPRNWKPIKFQKIERETRYQTRRDGERSVLHATADRSAAGLVWERGFDPAKTPWLSWEWKITSVLSRGDVTRKDGDDFSARVMVMFPYDPETANLFDAVKFEVAKALYGEYPPAAAITYIWANRLPQGAWATSTYTDRVRLLAVESGNQHAGQWRAAMRNIAQDFRQAFPRASLPPKARIAVMVDTDNTKDETQSWFDTFRLSAKE